MHVDESKKFDKRNLSKNIKSGIITQKEYEIFLSKLPDVSDKIFNPEEDLSSTTGEAETREEGEISSKKRELKKKLKEKGK